ncbi:MAG TPA: glycosyltransferase, partial [Trueperaceae bacterium]|nr:glycosyltransferase [Trueperaceae bacterium]
MRLALLVKRHSIHSVRWANALADRGHEVHLISAERHGEPLNPEVTVHFLPFPPLIGFYANALALRRLLHLLEPDLMNAHFASGYGTLARLCGFHPTVLSVWGSDVFDFPLKSRLHARLIGANLSFADAVTSTSEVMARQTRSLAPLEQVSVVP